jgi:hypothetical protein
MQDVVKAKSMTTEEVHLNDFLEKTDVEVRKRIWANTFSNSMVNSISHRHTSDA